MRAGHQGGDDLLRARVGDMYRAGSQRLAPGIWHADHRHVGPEKLHHRLGDGGERRLEREALGERLRDGVETPQLACGATLGLERALEHLRELLRVLVQARVLYRDRQLAGQCEQEPFLAFPVRTRPAS